MTRNRSLRVAVVTAVAGLGALAFSATANAAPAAVSTARPAAVQPAVDTPPTPTDLRVDGVTDTSVTVQSDNPAVPAKDATCSYPAYLYYLYVNGAFAGAGEPASPVLIASGLKPHTTYSIQIARQNICTSAVSAKSAPLTVTTLG